MFEPQNVRIRMMLYTETLPSRIRIQRVLTRWSFEQTMYVGIRPPPKYMVKVRIRMITRRNGR